MNHTAPFPSPASDYVAPLTMEWASDVGGPIWTSGRGVLTRTGGDPAAAPTTLVTGPAYGLVLPHGGTSDIIFTRWKCSQAQTTFPSPQDPSIHFAKKQADGTYAVRAVATFLNGAAPRTIERGPDGYYVMLSQQTTIPGAPLRIVKMKWDDSIPGSETLMSERLVVDGYPVGSAKKLLIVIPMLEEPQWPRAPGWHRN